MKKIIQINVVANTGSTGRIAEEIGNMAIDAEWESYIAYGRYGNPSTSKTIKIGNILDIAWHVFQTKLFDRHGMASTRATKILVNKIDSIKPDIIHLHNIHGYYINIKILFDYLSKKSIPIVWTLHDCWAFTGHCVHFEDIQCEKWKALCSKCPQTKSYPQSLFYDNSKKNYLVKKELFNSVENLTLIPVSYWLKDLVNQSFLNSIPTKVIHNGLDLNKFNVKSTKRVRKKYGLDEIFVILGVANIWSEKKGLIDFIKLSEKLVNNEKIILVGLNKNQINLLPKNIIGIKNTESIDELCEFYSLADVFVNPTYEDNFPTTNLEAQACGTPVITYNTGGSGEAISRETGFMVAKGNIQDLLNCIRKIKNIKKEHFSYACRKRAISLFDKNLKYKEYFDLYKQLLNKKD